MLAYLDVADRQFIQYAWTSGLVGVWLFFIMLGMAAARARNQHLAWGAILGGLLGVYGVLLLFIFRKGEEKPTRLAVPPRTDDPYARYGIQRKPQQPPLA